MGCIPQKYGINLAKLWDLIKLKQRDGLGKYGIYKVKSWDILRDIFFKSYRIYLLKAMAYICLKLRGILGKIIGYIMGYNWQYF